jgi:H/ACA ribonucleoprotein complex subunit 3
MKIQILENEKKVSMILRYYLDDAGRRVYTLSNKDSQGNQTFTAHPARFSPDDKFSAQRVACKRRFGLLAAHKGADKA